MSCRLVVTGLCQTLSMLVYRPPDFVRCLLAMEPRALVSQQHSLFSIIICSLFEIGHRIFEKISQLLVTLVILRALQLNFPSLFDFSFSPKLTTLSSPNAYSTELQQVVKYFADVEKECSSVYTRLELGLSWEDTLDKMLQSLTLIN